MNDDDDDYDGGRTADMAQTGAIELENDLLPILLNPIDPISEVGPIVIGRGVFRKCRIVIRPTRLPG